MDATPISFFQSHISLSTIRRLTTTKDFLLPNSTETHYPLNDSYRRPIENFNISSTNTVSPSGLVSVGYRPTNTMPVSRGKQYVTPTIVEVKPSNVGSNIAPSSPPPSPKAVRFAPSSSDVVTGVSRQLTPPEAWSLYYFESHARQCHECQDPLRVHLKGGRLCDTGHALAQDVAIHVYHHAGEVYSREKDDHKLVRVELPPGYDQVRGLLKSMDRYIRSSNRTRPIISYDSNYPVSARRRSSPERPRTRDEPASVIVEPTSSQRPQRTKSTKSKTKPSGYKTVVQDDVQPEPEPLRRPTRDQRRGSLYEDDLKRERKDKGYRVEIREPERERERRKKEHRKSGYHD